MGNFTQNVGRYAESLGGLFENVRKEIATLQTKQKELNERVKIQGFVTPEQQAEIDKTTTALTELNQVVAIGCRIIEAGLPC